MPLNGLFLNYKISSCLWNLPLSKVFVKIFVSWSPDLQNFNCTSSSSIASWIKWCLMAVCFILLWKTRFLVTVYCWLLSQWMVRASCFSPKYSRILSNHIACWIARPIEIYSTSAKDWDTICCFLWTLWKCTWT